LANNAEDLRKKKKIGKLKDEKLSTDELTLWIRFRIPLREASRNGVQEVKRG